MARDVISLLRKKGPGLTSNFISEMTSYGLSEAAARKRIQRAQPQLERLAGIRFEKNARFIYLPGQYGDQRFWRNFQKACQSSGKAYWAAISLLAARGGRIRKDHFARATAAPQSRSGQLSPDRIFERLQKVNVLDEIEENEAIYVSFKPDFFPHASISDIRAYELAEEVALHDIKDWARKLGLGSYGKFALRLEDPMPLVSGLLWDMTAPSYIRPLMSIRNGKPTPGFLVADINLRGSIGKAEAEAFIRKCDMAAAPQNVPPIMPILIGNAFDNETFGFLRSKGVLAVTLQNLFGEDIAQALRDLVSMLTDMGKRISADPDHLFRVVNSLTKIKGATDNMLGDLFELVIGTLVKDVEVGYLKTGDRRIDPETGRKTEIDVQLDMGHEKGVLVIECKAKNPGTRVSDDDIKEWYNDRVPLRYSALTSGGRYTDKPFRFELWTNGEFTFSGLKWLKAQKNKFEGYSIGWKEGTELKQYADKAKNKSLNEMLKQHYFRSPLKRVVEN